MIYESKPFVRMLSKEHSVLIVTELRNISKNFK